MNQGPNGSGTTPIGCGTATVSGSPFGSLDLSSAGPGGVFVAGWAIDPRARPSPPGSASTAWWPAP